MKNRVKFFWYGARGASITALVGLAFIGYSIYLQIDKLYQYTTLAGQQALYSAGAFHALCVNVMGNGAYATNPSTATNACADAAHAEAAKGHAFVLGIVLLMVAVFWANKRIKFWNRAEGWSDLSRRVDEKYGHGGSEHHNHNETCPDDDKPERDC